MRGTCAGMVIVLRRTEAAKIGRDKLYLGKPLLNANNVEKMNANQLNLTRFKDIILVSVHCKEML